MKTDIDQKQPETKRAYEPPQILSREVLEVVAGPCTGGKATTGTCPTGPILS